MRRVSRSASAIQSALAMVETAVHSPRPPLNKGAILTESTTVHRRSGKDL